MQRLLVTIFAVSSIWAGQGISQSSLELQSSPFNEIYREAAQISGVVVAGVLRHGDAPDGVGAVTLAADLPPEWAGSEVCARVLSSDGLYEASNIYGVPADWTGGRASLPFPSSYSELLAEAEPGEIAVQIAQGPCDTLSSLTAVAIWNEEGNAQLDLLINAFRADEVFIYADGVADPVRCTPLALSGASAFDYRCALPEGLSGQVALSIYRVVDGKPAPPDDMIVWIGNN